MPVRFLTRSVCAVVLSCVLLMPSMATASDDSWSNEGTALGDGPAGQGRSNQLSFGLGMIVAGAVSIGGASGVGVLPPSVLWFDLPLMYRHRVNSYFAGGGGLILSLASVGDGSGGSRTFLAGGELVGTIRAYFVPDWFYFDLSVMVGYPFLYAISPGIGLSIPMGDTVSLYLNNEFEMTFLGVFVGVYKPTIGLEFRF